MKSVFGTNIIYTIFGESHSEYMGITITGLKSGIKIDHDLIKSLIERRKPSKSFNTLIKEKDEYKIISGEFNGFTTGSPLTVLVKNEEMDSSKYQEGICRPGQSDYASFMKYDGFNDYRGGGHLSGRLTLLIVIAYGIIKPILDDLNIEISSKSYYEEVDNDTTGGKIEVFANNVKAGLGEPFFYSTEGILSNLFFSIPSVKAVEFGLGTKFSEMKGREVVEEVQYKDGKVLFNTNFNGGINGGITNGAEIKATLTFKPIASVPYEVNAINVKTKENIIYQNKSNHDLSIINRCGVIAEAMMGIGLLELITLDKAVK